MSPIITYLHGLCGDIYKLLPMKEEEFKGAENHIDDYLSNSLLCNVIGATKTFPVLGSDKNFIYVKNNLQYLASEKITFVKWRKIVLDSVTLIDKLCKKYDGESYG